MSTTGKSGLNVKLMFMENFHRAVNAVTKWAQRMDRVVSRRKEVLSLGAFANSRGGRNKLLGTRLSPAEGSGFRTRKGADHLATTEGWCDNSQSLES